jgi:hypothetical protein
MSMLPGAYPAAPPPRPPIKQAAPMGEPSWGPAPSPTPAPAVSPPVEALPALPTAPVRSVCDCCGLPRPTRWASINGNVGLLVVRFPLKVEGTLCRECIATRFWWYSAVTMVFGWWGIQSFFFSWAALFANVATYTTTRGMPRHGASA